MMLSPTSKAHKYCFSSWFYFNPLKEEGTAFRVKLLYDRYWFRLFTCIIKLTLTFKKRACYNKHYMSGFRISVNLLMVRQKTDKLEFESGLQSMWFSFILAFFSLLHMRLKIPLFTKRNYQDPKLRPSVLTWLNCLLQEITVNQFIWTNSLLLGKTLSYQDNILLIWSNNSLFKYQFTYQVSL